MEAGRFMTGMIDDNVIPAGARVDVWTSGTSVAQATCQCGYRTEPREVMGEIRARREALQDLGDHVCPREVRP